MVGVRGVENANKVCKRFTGSGLVEGAEGGIGVGRGEGSMIAYRGSVFGGICRGVFAVSAVSLER